jgi:CubicO group peptidase (beta-lactamase class C family)
MPLIRRTWLVPLICSVSAHAQARVAPARIDSIFAFAKPNTPGCAVATIRNGTIEYARGYGLADLEHATPITPKTAFYMASVSKQFTAAAINALVADGKLSLDDDVRKYVPEVPRYQAPMTVGQLMHHTSGLRDYLNLYDLAGMFDYPVRNSDFLEMISRQRSLNFAPGEQYSYTNSGYVMLSIIVERVSGKSLRAFANDRFFKPLGMTSTVFRDRIQMLIPNRALAYAREGDTWIQTIPAFDVVGDGGLFSTVEDLARWETFMLDPKAGGAKWRELESQRGKLTDGTTLNYGAGLSFGTFRGESMIEHSGGFAGYFTELMRFPRLKLSVALLCNGGANALTLAQRIAGLYIPEPTAVAQAGASRLSLKDRAMLPGRFFNDQTMTLRDVRVDNGKLFYVRGSDDRSELAPLTAGRFRMVGTERTIRFAGRDTLIFEASPGNPPSTFRRVTSGKRDPRGYVGTYVNFELPARWTIQVKGSRVTVVRPRGGNMDLENIFDDAYRWGAYVVRFTRDARGTITGLEASAGERARRVRFDRLR